MPDNRHDIEKYLSGRMSPEEMHRFEKKALDDPFLTEALEGAEMIRPGEFSNDVSSLQEQVAKRLGSRAAAWWLWPSRIAAAAAVLIVTGYLVERFGSGPAGRELAVETQEHTLPETAGASKDSALRQAEAPSRNQVHPENDRSKQGPSRRQPREQQAPVFVTPQQEDEDQEQPVAVTTAEAAMDTMQTKASRIAVADETAQSRQPGLAAREPVSGAEFSGAAGAKTEMKAGAEMKTGAVRGIHGVVTAEGTPVPGVNVLVKGGTAGTVTNAKGEYELDLADSQSELVFSFIGYQTTEVAARGKSRIDVELAPDVLALSEVVVTGYGVSGGAGTITPTFEPASPEGGQKAFRDYLEASYRYPPEAHDQNVEGRITVQFYVEMDGTPAGFEILKGLGYGCDDELIRIIREGPRWIPSKLNGIPTREQVKVRFRVQAK